MKISLASILLGAATLIGGTLGTAHTHHGAFATHLHPRQSPLYQGFEELANLSTILFAWQLAGGAPNQTTLQYMCTNFSMISGTWGAVGFKLPLIKQVSRFCSPNQVARLEMPTNYFRSSILLMALLPTQLLLPPSSRFTTPRSSSLRSST